MPCNEVDDGIQNLYELHNSSQGQHKSQVVGGNFPVFDYSQWVGKLTGIGTPQGFNEKNYSLQHLDSLKGHGCESIGVPFKENYTQLTPRAEYSISLAINNLLNADDVLLGCQNLRTKQSQPRFPGEVTYDQQILTSRGVSIFKSQQENECADSPTLTTNSERSEIAEASSDFNFLRGQQHFVRDQRFTTPQPYAMQQSGYSDMQLLKQHMMFKQLQELQRQQQLQQLGEVRQQSSLNQFSAVAKQAAGSQFSPLINGTPVHDASQQMLRGWMQRGACPSEQGLSNKIMFSQEQSQALRAMGLTSQQLDTSLYGTPISNTRGNMSQYPHLQAIPHDSINLLTKASGQVQKSLLQSSGFGNPYAGDQSTVSSDLIGLPQGSIISKQGFQAMNNFGQYPIQGLHSSVFPGNLREGIAPQANASAKEFNGRQEQGGSPARQQTAKQFGPSQGLVPLDPMEAKILYNMDDNIWEAFGGRIDVSIGGFSNPMEQPDSSNAFPSLQSGSWSALMQSAVAEASSSDTGLQEEWSGLTFQNTEHSTDNQMSNFVDSEKQQTGWTDNNLQRASSFSSKPFPTITDSSMSSRFPGFQQPGIQLSIELGEDMCQARSHESIENYNPQLKTSVEEGQKVQTFMHSDNAWAGQMFEHAQSNVRHQRVASSDISMDSKGNESMGKSQSQISNDPHVAHKSYKGTNETYETQQNRLQRENPSDCYTSKGLSDHEQGHVERFKFFGNVSRGDINIDKGLLSDFQGNSRASEEVLLRGDNGSSTSAILHGSVLPDGSPQSSEHMLELLHKVDQPRDDSAIPQFGSTDHHPLPDMPGTDSLHASVAQSYTQSSASQAFGLRLAPPSQKLPNSSSFISPQDLPQDLSNLNGRQVNPELGEKNQTWLAPPSSFQPLPSSHEPSQRAHWDKKSGNSGHTGFSSHLNVQGNSVASFSRNHPQMHPLPTVPVASQSLQAASPGTTSRSPHFNIPSSPDISQQIFTNAVSQQCPVLEVLPASEPSVMSCMSQQGEISARQLNVWRNVPTQRQTFGMEPLKFPSLPSSLDASNNSMISTSQAPHGSNDQNSMKPAYKSSEIGASSDSQGFDSGDEHLGKEMSLQQILPKTLGASQAGGVFLRQQPVSDAAALSSGSLASLSPQQDLDGVKHGDNPAPASTEKNLEAFSYSGNQYCNYSLLQVRAMNNGADGGSEVQQTTALGGQHLVDSSSRFTPAMDSRQISASQPKPFSTGDVKMLSFLAEARDGLSVKASLQSAPQARPQDMVTFGHNDSLSQSSGSNLPPNHVDHSRIYLRMAPSWFKQYGTLRNGQMVPMFDTRLAQNAATQFAFGKLIQNFHIQTSSERLDAADAGQGVGVWPSMTAALVAGQNSPYMLPSEPTNQVAIIRPKKRKIVTPELLPWHKEVGHDSNRLQNISVAEQDWARVANRLVEKVADEVEIVEGVQPMHQSKRRLILTTQLMQQLFFPSPASIFSADLASNYDIVSYFISRLSLGDACGLAYCKRNDMLTPLSDNMNSEKLTITERGGDQHFSEVLEGFIDRANKLENDFQRLDKAASVVDIRVEFQELERFSVINRFAKFHVRGQSDTSGTSSSSGTSKPIPQRYVTAYPMPRNLPEGVQCFSL